MNITYIQNIFASSPFEEEGHIVLHILVGPYVGR
jgi:hypothetical protein